METVTFCLRGIRVIAGLLLAAQVLAFGPSYLERGIDRPAEWALVASWGLLSVVLLASTFVTRRRPR